LEAGREYFEFKRNILSEIVAPKTTEFVKQPFSGKESQR
jgi:hypothetical protein